MLKHGQNSPRAPHPVDREVGQNIRRLRRERRMSQEALAAAIGLTFQQLQKYECGRNRVSCSRLCEIAAALGVHAGALLPTGDAAAVAGPPNALHRLQTRLNEALSRLPHRQARILCLVAEALTTRKRV